jgi:hypothetical protein
MDVEQEEKNAKKNCELDDDVIDLTASQNCDKST